MKLTLLAISVCLLAVNAMPVAEQSSPVSDTAGEVPQHHVPLEKTSINVQDVPIKSSDVPHEEKPGSLENVALRKKSVDVQEGAGKVSEEPIVPAVPAEPAAESLNVKSEPIAETAAEPQRNLPMNEAVQKVEGQKAHSEIESHVDKKIELDDKKEPALLNLEGDKQKKEEELKEKEKLKTAASEPEKIVVAQENQQPIPVAETPVTKQEEPLQVKSIVEHPVEPKSTASAVNRAQEEQKQVSPQESMARKEENLPLVPEPSKVGVAEHKEVIPAGEVLKKEVVPKESLGDKPDRVIREAEEAAAAAAKAAAGKVADPVLVPIANQKPLEMTPEPVKQMEEKKKEMKEDKKQEDRATRGAQESEVSQVVSKKVEEQAQPSKIASVETKQHPEQVQPILKSGEPVKPEGATEPQVKSVQVPEVKPQSKSEIQGEEKVAETQQSVTQEASKTLLGGASDSSEESSEEVKSLSENHKSIERNSEEKDDKSSSEEKESKSVDSESKPELLPKPEEVKDSKDTIKLEGSSAAAAALHSTSGSSSSSSLTSSSQQGVGETISS